MPHLLLSDRSLWGNEAADDEDPVRLNSYFVSQPAWQEFFESSNALSIARARKGMGKSALLRECAFLAERKNSHLVIAIKGSDLVAQKEFKSQSPIEHIYDWQQRICTIVTRHIGVNIGAALSDDQITLVESAELAGYKSRNLVGMLIDRLKGKLGSVEVAKLEVKDSKAILGRFLAGEEARVLLLIDDIDATFNNTREEAIRLSTFFSACRDLASNYKGLVIRTVIRADVWASIRKSDEALDKVEQYIFDLKWSQNEFRRFLAERIGAYVTRNEGESAAKGLTTDQIVGLVFEGKFPWGKSFVEPHRIIHRFSGGRPRWASQLCRLAGAEAVKVEAPRIKSGHITQVLGEFGRYRLDDVAREHAHQCPNMANIVNAFSRQRSNFTTANLLVFIRERITRHMKVEIDGREVDDPLEIARFLFQVGFLVGVLKEPNGQIEYCEFEHNPELLKNEANLDDGMDWLIHHLYHRHLSLEAPR